VRTTEAASSGVVVVETTPLADARGTAAPAIGGRRIKQINHSSTVTVGAVRGRVYSVSILLSFPRHSGRLPIGFRWLE